MFNQLSLNMPKILDLKVPNQHTQELILFLEHQIYINLTFFNIRQMPYIRKFLKKRPVLMILIYFLNSLLNR